MFNYQRADGNVDKLRFKANKPGQTTDPNSVTTSFRGREEKAEITSMMMRQTSSVGLNLLSGCTLHTDTKEEMST